MYNAYEDKTGGYRWVLWHCGRVLAAKMRGPVSSPFFQALRFKGLWRVTAKIVFVLDMVTVSIQAIRQAISPPLPSPTIYTQQPTRIWS